MALVKRGGAELTVEESAVDMYLSRGYDLINGKGEVIEEGTPQSKEGWMNACHKAQEKIKALEKENAELRNKLGEKDKAAANHEEDKAEGETKEDEAKEFACPYCDYTAGRQSDLTKHINSKHPEHN